MAKRMLPIMAVTGSVETTYFPSVALMPCSTSAASDRQQAGDTWHDWYEAAEYDDHREPA